MVERGQMLKGFIAACAGTATEPLAAGDVEGRNAAMDRGRKKS